MPEQRECESVTTPPQCVDLRALFGDRFRIEYEESYQAEKPEFRAEEAARLTIIPCKFGHIYALGGTKLAAWTRSRKRRRMLEDLGCCHVHQDCDGETTVLFELADFDRIAEIMRPKRRRRLSLEPLKRHHAPAAETDRFASSIGTLAGWRRSPAVREFP